MNTNTNSNVSMMEILAVTKRHPENRDEKGWWTRIGVAFQNRDGSWNLKFDFFPTNLEATTVQLREPRAKEEKETEAAE